MIHEYEINENEIHEYDIQVHIDIRVTYWWHKITEQ